MSEYRKRDKTLTIRLTKSEKSAIIAKADAAKLSLTDFIVALSKQVTINPPPDLSPLLVELKRIGNNINQIAAKVNSGVVYVRDLQTVIEMQKSIYNQLLAMTENTWRQ